jgi:hypothetical protein
LSKAGRVTLWTPIHTDPQAIDTALRAIVREGAYGSWFGKVGFHGIEDGFLILSTPSGIAADRIKRDYTTAILQAAEVAGIFVERVLVVLRKDHR